MGTTRKLCKQGHKLEEPNLYINLEGFRECKICADKRWALSRRERRLALKWLKLIIRTGELRNGDFLYQKD